MRCFRGGITWPAALVLALWPAASLLAQEYEIRLHRPEAVGLKYHLSATGRSSRTKLVRSGDKILENDAVKFAVDCECDVTVLAVDDKGKPAALSLQVEKLARTDDAGARDLVSKGSVITVSVKDEVEASEMSGHRLPLETQEAITVILPLDPYGPTQDQLFGTTGRKKPGDHWEANTDLLAKDLLRRGVTVNKADLTGTVAFEKLVSVGGTECMQISRSVDCSKYIPSVPSEVKVAKGFLKIEFLEKLPLVASLPALEVSQSATTGYTMTGRPDPASGEVTIDFGAALDSLSRVSDVQEPAKPAAH